jgi:hypothetical protein
MKIWVKVLRSNAIFILETREDFKTPDSDGLNLRWNN